MKAAECRASTVGLLLSGGLDSAILLGWLLRQNQRVQPFYVRSFLVWEPQELLGSQRFLQAMRDRHTPGTAEELVILDLPVHDLYGHHWSVTGVNPPNDQTADDAVYLPGRNLLLIAKVALWCQLHAIGQLALGVLNSNPFADATPTFFDQYQRLLSEAFKTPLEILRPFACRTKQQVIELGRDLPLDLTFSCIAPVGALHCGRCNKCAERRLAFQHAHIPDPTPYAAGPHSTNS